MLVLTLVLIITLSMTIQVRAEVAERLDGVVSSVEDLRSQLEGALARVRQLMPLGMTMIPCLAAKSELCKYCKNAIAFFLAYPLFTFL